MVIKLYYIKDATVITQIDLFIQKNAAVFNTLLLINRKENRLEEFIKAKIRP
jgi:hypothetical protein